MHLHVCKIVTVVAMLALLGDAGSEEKVLKKKSKKRNNISSGQDGDSSKSPSESTEEDKRLKNYLTNKFLLLQYQEKLVDIKDKLNDVEVPDNEEQLVKKEANLELRMRLLQVQENWKLHFCFAVDKDVFDSFNKYGNETAAKVKVKKYILGVLRRSNKLWRQNHMRMRLKQIVYLTDEDNISMFNEDPMQFWYERVSEKQITRCQHYNVEYKCDISFLITEADLPGGKKSMINRKDTLCERSSSCSVVGYDKSTATVGQKFTIEVGRLIGLYDDDSPDCVDNVGYGSGLCIDHSNGCVMTERSIQTLSATWSACSLSRLAEILSSKPTSCFRKPSLASKKLMEKFRKYNITGTCGNGVKEIGEYCDCPLRMCNKSVLDDRKNSCNPYTCQELGRSNIPPNAQEDDSQELELCGNGKVIGFEQCDCKYRRKETCEEQLCEPKLCALKTCGDDNITLEEECDCDIEELCWADRGGWCDRKTCQYVQLRECFKNGMKGHWVDGRCKTMAGQCQNYFVNLGLSDVPLGIYKRNAKATEATEVAGGGSVVQLDDTFTQIGKSWQQYMVKLGGDKTARKILENESSGSDGFCGLMMCPNAFVAKQGPNGEAYDYFVDQLVHGEQGCENPRGCTISLPYIKRENHAANGTSVWEAVLAEEGTPCLVGKEQGMCKHFTHDWVLSNGETITYYSGVCDVDAYKKCKRKGLGWCISNDRT